MIPFEACRGTKKDKGCDYEEEQPKKGYEPENALLDEETRVVHRVPIEADFLFGYSAVPGTYTVLSLLPQNASFQQNLWIRPCC